MKSNNIMERCTNGRFVLFSTFFLFVTWIAQTFASMPSPAVTDGTTDIPPPVFSNDGTKLAIPYAGGAITVFDVTVTDGQEIASFDAGSVSAVETRPDGKLIASAAGPTISLWDVGSGDEIKVLRAHNGKPITRLAFNLAGNLLAAVNGALELEVWDVDSAEPVAVLSDDAGEISEIALSADGKFIAGVTDRGSEVTVWDLVRRGNHKKLSSATGAAILDIAFSPIGKKLAATDEDGNIVVWDMEAGSEKLLAEHVHPVRSFMFSPDGSTLASDGLDAQLILWDTASGEWTATLPARLDNVATSLAFSPNGTMLASVGEGDEINLWDVASGELVGSLVGSHEAYIQKFAFGPSGKTLTSIDANGLVIAWDLSKGLEGREGSELFNFDSSPSKSATSESTASLSDESTVAQTSDPGLASVSSESSPSAPARSRANQSARKTDVGRTHSRSKKKLTGRYGHDGPVFIAVNPDGTRVVAGSAKRLMRLRTDADDTLTPQSTETLEGTTGVAFGSRHSRFYSVGRDTKVRRWNSDTGKLVQVLSGPEHPVRAVAVSHDDSLVASAGEETRVMVWSGSGKLVQILSAHRDFVNALAFNPSKLELATGGQDGRIFLWNPLKRKPKRALLGHAGAVTALVYSPDGGTIFSGGADATVKVWKTSTGQQVTSLAHPSKVQAIAVNKSGQYLATAGQGERVYVWDLAAGPELLRTIDTGASNVTSLAFVRHNRLLVGEEDGSVSSWNISKRQKVQTIEIPLSGLVAPASESSRTCSFDPRVRTSPERVANPDHTTIASRKGFLSAVVEGFVDWLIPAAHAQSLPDPNQGPGGPILVIDSASSEFGKYYAEILRTEGLNEFQMADIGSVTPQVLAAYDVVILAPMTLSDSQTTMLGDWVNAGGNLVAMRPDTQLTGLLGLTATGQNLADGYLLVDTSSSPGNGIVAQTLQFHGTASLFNSGSSDVTTLATLYSDSETATAYPAVTIRNVGTNGGQAAAFAYDLATSIVYSRQGNPAWANQERDGYEPQRPDDKYFGDSADDPQTDWVDLNKIAVPQADEQQRFLANLILYMNLDKRPLPRFWYFPRGEKAVVIMTGDDHANNGTAGRWDQFLAASPVDCSVEDWECVRGTSYLFTGTPLTDAEAAAYEAQGFEVGLHLDTGCADFTESELDAYYAQQIAEFSTEWPSVPLPSTQRHHCIAWTDWVIGAKVQLKYGIRLDTSYYFWPPEWVLNRPGFMTGSGMPMRFADLDGTLIDVYQAATQMTDESGQEYPYTIDTLLDRALGSEGYYGAYTINAHTDLAEIPESDAVVASALARDVPIITSQQMLEWLDGRNSSSFGSIAWTDNVLSFTVIAGTGANGLQALVPTHTNAGIVNSVTLNGANILHTSVSRKGVDYVSFSATDGAYAVTYGPDTTAPTVTSVFPVSGATDVSQGIAITAVFSESMDATTTNSSTFELRNPIGDVVTATVSYNADTQTATLEPSSSLAADTEYTAIIYGGGAADISGNPLAADFTWSFTTGSTNCPCTIWSSSDTPANPSEDDPSDVELGVQFKSEMSGYITGIRFYKGSGNTGTHVGNLWATDGTLLATATFSNETASGWQQVDFDAPVAITANTVYVASYHTDVGGYAADGSYFSSSGVDNAPLYALSNAESGANGVYLYGSGGFPSDSYGATNYWVDVVFVPDLGPDTVPPAVTTTLPATGGVDVGVNTAVTATFNEEMDATTITSTTFELRDGGNTLVPAAVTYDGVTKTATLTPTSALTAASTYTATVKGGTGGVTDLAGNALAADVAWSFTTAAADTTAPTVSATTPTDGATGVSIATSVVATFDEPIDSATLDGSTFELRDSSNALVSGTVAYDAQTRTATLVPSATLVTDSQYAATLKGGAGGVTDLVGNALASDVTWSFTTAAQTSGPCDATPCSLWDVSATPSVVTESDPNAVELGVKVQSEVDGYVTGVRFYKGSQNTGTHVGSLWSSSGQLLAQATFSNETTSGWQQVDFATPVAIQANTVYIVSYHTEVGYYSADGDYFASAYSNGPLSAPADGTSDGNGVYQYGSGGFPDQTWNASNYWVDLVFTTNTGPDTTPPTLTVESPSDGAVNVPLDTHVAATFNESMDASTIGATTFELRDGAAALIPSSVTYDAGTRTAILIPESPLTVGGQYSATVKGGSSGVTDTVGNALASDVTWAFTTVPSDPCTDPANAIVAENCLAGDPASEWDISGAGDTSIQGFATDISVNRGETVEFKIDTNADDYRLDIYRMGYYGGAGARKVDSILPSATLPQNQPACLEDTSTALTDCGNWGVSASWTVPSDATSGIYFAKAVRGDTDGASHIVFIVRDDASSSDILFQTSDTTWQAYNTYGGSSLYSGGPGPQEGAYKVSYNRPFDTRSNDDGQDWLFNAEYPMVRWLESNGYDVSYFTGVDTDRLGSLITNHRVFLSVGHDEYWSADQRANVEAARDAGVHLAFFSANEVFWKTRWENSVDGSAAPYRTLVCYKETHANAVVDPQDPPTWTGTWRDPRFSPPGDGGRPENELTGTIFTVNDGAATSIEVPAEDGKMRFWRNTDIANLATGETATLPFETLGYEWDEDLDNGFRPAGLVRMSTTTVEGAPVLTDYGSNYGSGTATHHLTLYRASSGALVFGAGTVQWPWGLDSNHDRGNESADPRMQQATVNLFADMDVQPGTLQTGLVPAAASTDVAAPASLIAFPAAGANLPEGETVTVTGTATDSGGGIVGAVEVSVDGGLTWHPADGRSSWSYEWLPAGSGVVNIRTRAADDSGNLEESGVGIDVTIGSVSDIDPPEVSSITPVDGATEVAIGTVVTAAFNEAMDATTITSTTFELRDGGNTLVPAAVTYDGVTKTATLTPTSALTAAATYTATVKGGTGGVTDLAGNALAADVAWSFTTAAADTTAPTVSATTPTDGATGVSVSTSVMATFDEPIDSATLDGSTFELRDSSNALVSGTVAYDAQTRTATLVPSATLATDSQYAATLKGGAGGVTDLVGNALASDVTWSFTTAAQTSGLCDATPCSLWDVSATPSVVTELDGSAVELGVKVQSEVDGYVTGVRFYKGSQNTGTHVGSLWSSSGQLLAQATFSNETASGWQQVDFATPVAIQVNTVYIVSYHTEVGYYSADGDYFASAYSNGPLSAPADGTSDGNGVYQYGSGGFPDQTWNASNYWVDLVFTTTDPQ